MQSENAQVHTVVFYCSRGERSVKCVRIALEMEASKEKQRGVVRFLVAEGAGTREIHRRMFAVYGKHCMPLASVHEWQKRFREGRTSLQDDSSPGQAHLAITPDVIARIHGLIQENRRITEEQIRVQSALAIAPCLPLSKITCSSEKFARSGFCIN